jgi:hypothetical protein
MESTFFYYVLIGCAVWFLVLVLQTKFFADENAKLQSKLNQLKQSVDLLRQEVGQLKAGFEGDHDIESGIMLASLDKTHVMPSARDTSSSSDAPALTDKPAADVDSLDAIEEACKRLFDSGKAFNTKAADGDAEKSANA